MKNLILISAVFVLVETFAASPAATQKWVRDFIATNGVASMSTTTYSNNVLSTMSVGGTNAVNISIEDGTVFALRATNVTSSTTQLYGITNGFTFVWRGAAESNGIYKTGGVSILAFQSSYDFNGIASTNSAYLSWFNDDFAVFGVILQPSVANGFKENE